MSIALEKLLPFRLVPLQAQDCCSVSLGLSRVCSSRRSLASTSLLPVACHGPWTAGNVGLDGKWKGGSRQISFGFCLAVFLLVLFLVCVCERERESVCVCVCVCFSLSFGCLFVAVAVFCCWVCFVVLLVLSQNKMSRCNNQCQAVGRSTPGLSKSWNL